MNLFWEMDEISWEMSKRVIQKFRRKVGSPVFEVLDPPVNLLILHVLNTPIFET